MLSVSFTRNCQEYTGIKYPPVKMQPVFFEASMLFTTSKHMNTASSEEHFPTRKLQPTNTKWMQH